MLRKQRTMLNDQQTRLRQYAGQVASYEHEINRLKAQLDKLRRMLLGQSSEKSRNKLENKIRQAEKRLSELESRLEAVKTCLNGNEPVPDTPADTVAVPQTTPEKSTHHTARKPLPADLPRETRTLLPATSVCPSCDGELKVMGETISERLEIINTAFEIIETVRLAFRLHGGRPPVMRGRLSETHYFGQRLPERAAPGTAHQPYGVQQHYPACWDSSCS